MGTFKTSRNNIVQWHSTHKTKELTCPYCIMDSLQKENKELRAALTISRGQWIHSVNAKQCLTALRESE